MPTTYAIPDGRTVMAATLYAGTSVAQSIVNTVNGVSFQPDFVWGKNRTNVNSHRLTDVNRGVGKVLFSDGTAGDTTGDGQLSSFNSNGFSLTGGAGAFEGLNQSGNNYVAWQWKAGGTAVSNTAGSITSSVSANTTAGFSVVTYTGNGTSGSTIGHGLGVAPKLILIKRRQGTNNWAVAGSILGSASTLYLNLTNAMETYTVALIGNIQTSTTFQVGNDGNRNESGGTFVAYCFAAVAGYSAFGSYTGNGSADGPFVFLGFRPRFVIIRRTDAGNNWHSYTSTIDPSNVVAKTLYPNTSGTEGTENDLDFVSNGMKMRDTGTHTNASGGTYIYMAWAENPFKFANAR